MDEKEQSKPKENSSGPAKGIENTDKVIDVRKGMEIGSNSDSAIENGALGMKTNENPDITEQSDSEPNLKLKTSGKSIAQKSSSCAKEESVTTPSKDKSRVETPNLRASSGRKSKKRNSLDVLLTDMSPTPSGKRERKSTPSFAPQDFKAEKEDGKVDAMKVAKVEGRGVILGSLPGVEDAMKMKSKKNPAVLTMAHKLVFGTKRRGKPSGSSSKAHVDMLIGQLLEFSGYLLPVENDKTSEDIENDDKDIETKMSVKAYKMTVPVLKDLCDFFDVDRSSSGGGVTIDKDTIIDRLLSFLGNPHEKFTRAFAKSNNKSSQKKKKPSTQGHKDKKIDGADEDDVMDEESDSEVRTPSPKKHKKSKVIKEDDETESEDDFEEDDEDVPLKMPTKKELRKWVQAYVACFNLDKATTNHAMKTAGDKFGIDLSSKKTLIKQLLAEEM